MNMTELFASLMILSGPIGGFFAAHSEKAGIVSVVLFIIGGVIEGYGVAMLSAKIVDSILMSKRLSAGAGLIFSWLVLVVGLLAAMFAPVWLAVMIYE